MKISFLIPVYNTAPHLVQCIQSLLGQTQPPEEIVLVDDGSTDGSGQLCDSLSQRFPSIKVIHQVNSGASAARNLAVHEATGDYVVFLDSDDCWLVSDALANLTQQLKKSQPDLLLFKRVDIYPHKRTEGKDYDAAYIRSHTGGEVFNYLIRNRLFQMSACFQLIRRQLLIEHQIQFPVGIVSEDLFWNLSLWQHIQKVDVSNIPLYGYQHREGSITSSYTLHHVQSCDYIFTEWKQRCETGCRYADSILIYLSDRWVSSAYLWGQLPMSDRTPAASILARHSDLLQHAQSRKAGITKLLYSLMGCRMTLTLCSLYWKLRARIKRV